MLCSRAGKLLAFAAASWMGASALATVQLSTGFEAPGYAPGNLVGQSGWVGFNTAPNQPVVQTAVVSSGSQAVKWEVAADTATDVAAAWKPVNQTVGAETQWTVQWDMRRDTSVDSTGFSIGVYANNGNDWLGELGTFDVGSGEAVYFVANNGTGPSLFGTNIPAPAYGQWANYKMEFNYVTQTYRVSVNGTYYTNAGQPVDIPFMAAANTFSDADITNQFDPAGIAYYDNLQITSTAVPEPAVAGVLGVSVLGAGLRRRRS